MKNVMPLSGWIAAVCAVGVMTGAALADIPGPDGRTRFNPPPQPEPPAPVASSPVWMPLGVKAAGADAESPHVTITIPRAQFLKLAAQAGANEAGGAPAPGSAPQSDAGDGASGVRTIVAGIALSAAIVIAGLMFFRHRQAAAALVLCGGAIVGAAALSSFANAPPPPSDIDRLPSEPLNARPPGINTPPNVAPGYDRPLTVQLIVADQPNATITLSPVQFKRIKEQYELSSGLNALDNDVAPPKGKGG